MEIHPMWGPQCNLHQSVTSIGRQEMFGLPIGRFLFFIQLSHSQLETTKFHDGNVQFEQMSNLTYTPRFTALYVCTSSSTSDED
jgi:hypothetical protein